MFINSATRQIYSGEDGIVVIPVLFRHRYQAWKPNNGGIAYDMGQDSTLYDSLPESQEEKSKGKRFDQHGNEVVNSMEYIVLIIDPKTGVFEQAVIPFSGVFAKKAKRWNNLIRGKVELHKGKAVRPAIFFYAYKITTVPETNDRGSWYSHNVENFAKVPELPFGADLFKAAGMLRQSVLAGEVQTASEAPGDGGLDTEHNAF